ncbi:MAG: sel1 repeat family protein, partial [Bacteroidaceae bacterium]|nr:sel1 repeat family protein [Bacteroidaceae bacterium]
AQCNLGYCYGTGSGVEKDPTEAVKWYRKAAEQGQVNAQYNLGLCYEIGVAKDLAEAVKWYRKAAEQGHADAKAALQRLNKK